MKLVYVGESPAREVVVPGGIIPVVFGVPFEVDTELGHRLLEQDIFEKAAPAKKASE